MSDPGSWSSGIFTGFLEVQGTDFWQESQHVGLLLQKRQWARPAGAKEGAGARGLTRCPPVAQLAGLVLMSQAGLTWQRDLEEPGLRG